MNALLLLPLLLGAASSLARYNYPSVTDRDSGVRDVSASAHRQGRLFHFYSGNGTAIVNTTTVAVSASFAAVVALGLWSIYSGALADADAKAAAAVAASRPPTRSEDDEVLRKVDLHAMPPRSQSDEEEEEMNELARYEREYAECLRLHAAWAASAANGQETTAEEERRRRRKR